MLTTTPIPPVSSPRMINAKAGEDFLRSIARTAIVLRFSETNMAAFGPLSSRVLGPGYWEEGTAWPEAGGAAMSLLLQINWSEVSASTTPEDRAKTQLALPEVGITQFYLHPCDPAAGCELRKPCSQQGWRIVHWENPSQERFVRSPAAPGIIHPMFPVINGAAISFVAVKQNGNLTDAMEGLGEPDFAEDAFEDMLDNMKDHSTSQIGGFPFFLCADPRKSRIADGCDFRLFLQLGSEGPFHWGEEGQAHWFIKPSDLKALRFDSVSYTCESA